MEARAASRDSRTWPACAALAGMLAAGAAPVAWAQGAADYPSRPVTIVSPFTPGSVVDADGRVWAQKLQESLGKPFVLDFKPGAGSTLGTNYVAKAAPDGYTLLIMTSSFTVNAATYKSLPFDPVKDFAPVSLTVSRPTVLAVRADLPVNDFPGYVAYARANPDKLNFGTSGAGGIYHMVGAWLHSATNTKATFVHYKGAGGATTDLVAGRLDALPPSLFGALPMLKSGKVKAIAVLSPERTSLLPGMKTVAEQGVPGFDYSTWGGVLAPAGTPPAIVGKLGAEFGRMMKAPDVIARFKDDGTVLIGSSPEYFRKYVVEEIARWRKLAQQFGITAAEG